MCSYLLNAALQIIIFDTLMVSIKCSISETFLPTDLLVSKYCPETSLCPFRGSHTMCQTNINDFGESCFDKQVNITMHPELATQILSLMNAMRSKVAKGKELSKSASFSGESFRLPRGYSMWKLEWDSELATFAQVWANQCLAKYDVCHASENFPLSTQIVHDLKFDRRYSDDLSDIKAEELGWAINVMFRSIYESKNKHKVTNSVTHLCLLRCGEPLDRVYNYLQIINGANTHVGCGLSLSKIRENSDRAIKSLQWRLLLICNFSHRTMHMQPLYTIVRPESNHSGLTYSPCGCPTGSIEMPDCLCEIQKRPRCHDPKCAPQMLSKHSITSKNVVPGLETGVDGAIVEGIKPKRPTSAPTILYFGPDILRLNKSWFGRQRRINSIYAYHTEEGAIHPDLKNSSESTTKISLFLIPQPFRLYKSNLRGKKNDNSSKKQFTNLQNKDPMDKENKLLDFVNELEGNLKNTQLTEDTKVMLTEKVKQMQYITKTHGANKEKRYDKDLMKSIQKHYKVINASKRNGFGSTRLPRITRPSLFLKPKPFVLYQNHIKKSVTHTEDHTRLKKLKRQKNEVIQSREVLRENKIVAFVNKLERDLKNAQLTEDTKHILKKKIKRMQYEIHEQNSKSDYSDVDDQEIELLENFANIHNDDASE